MAKDAFPSCTVLVVDDEPDVRLNLARVLESALEVRVVEAANAAEALGALGRSSFDLIISDHRMPGMRGDSLLARCAELAPDTPRIMLTAYADVTLAQSAINQGRVSRFLRKPVDARDLVEAARETLAERLRDRHASAAFDRSRQFLGGGAGPSA